MRARPGRRPTPASRRQAPRVEGAPLSAKMLYDRRMQDAFAYCEALVRGADKDRFLASLFAPTEHRAALHALYAFNLEIARVRENVHEPLAGEIRMQWWTDAIAGRAAGEVSANPV